MRLREVTLLGYRSVSFLQFEAAQLTVLFGKNNAGKTNVLEAIYGVLAPDALSPENKGRTPARGVSHPDDLERFEETGAMPPKLFGVPEDDLLYALPADAIREHFNPAFPGWQELKREWQAAKERNVQVSKNWKAYAETTYGVPIKESDGVRRVVHILDLAGVELPSLRSVVDAIINWAGES